MKVRIRFDLRGTPIVETDHGCVALPQGVLLPGWDCPECRAFNGDAKERLTRCRCCDAARPES